MRTVLLLSVLSLGFAACRTASDGGELVAADVADVPLADGCPGYLYEAATEAFFLDAGPTGDFPKLAQHPGLPVDLRGTAAHDPFGFGCYGGCGPSCKADCESGTEISKLYEVAFKDGTKRCQRCTYSRSRCKSHRVCRYHDECYRKVDLAEFAAIGDELKPPSPISLGYRNCDLEVAMNENTCWLDYAQGKVANAPECWDGTWAQFAQLVRAETAACDAGAEPYPSGLPSPSIKKIALGKAAGALAKFKYGQTLRFCRKAGMRVPSRVELTVFRKQFGASGIDPTLADDCIWTGDLAATGSGSPDYGSRLTMRNESGAVQPMNEAKRYCYAVCVAN